MLKDAPAALSGPMTPALAQPNQAAAPASAGPAGRSRDLRAASHWRLMWLKFRRHRLAVICGLVVILLYAAAAFAEFLAPYDPEAQNSRNAYHPPTPIHLVDAQGGVHLRPFVYGTASKRNPATFELEFVEDTNTIHPIRFFVKSEPYPMWGLFTLERRLFGIDDPGVRLFVLGADRQGRDLFSRIVYGTRLSMSIGLVGVAVSFVIGIAVGGVSGYYGGVTDLVAQRMIEFVRSMPTIPLWLGLAAALPADWSILKVYLAITVILSLIGWTSLAQVVRGRCLALREEDFVLAARLCGSSQTKIIFRHMVPTFLSHIIATSSLAIPVMIINETSLSFLGLGIRPPAISWGVLLQEAQNIQTLALAPWLLIPGLVVIVAVLAFNLVGDGLRDAADPYGN